MAESIRIILAVNKRKNALIVIDNVLHPNTEDLYQIIFKIEHMSNSLGVRLLFSNI